MENHFFTKATQLALKAAAADPEACRKVLDLGQFRGREEVVFTKPIKTDSYSFFLVDVTLDENQQWRIIESNGSNGALSSTAVGGEAARVEHLLELFLSKPMSGKRVVLFSHQYQFIHLGEFFNRAAAFASALSAHHDVALVGVDEKNGQEEVIVVAGEIGAIARKITIEGGAPLYAGMPIVLASNPNLLPELERLKIIVPQRQHHLLDEAIFQEQRCTPLIHDKSLQQDHCLNTGMLPILYKDAHSVAACYETLEHFGELGKIAVAKMNAGSGGTGIDFFEPGLGKEQAASKLNDLFEGVRKKYSADADQTMFPIRFFEFVKAQPLMIEKAPHLWDMRMQVIVYPNKMEIRPCVVRACPKPFDGSYIKPTVVNNLSGRSNPEDLATFIFMNPYQKNGIIHRLINIPTGSLENLAEMLFGWTYNAVSHS